MIFLKDFLAFGQSPVHVKKKTVSSSKLTVVLSSSVLRRDLPWGVWGCLQQLPSVGVTGIHLHLRGQLYHVYRRQTEQCVGISYLRYHRLLRHRGAGAPRRPQEGREGQGGTHWRPGQGEAVRREEPVILDDPTGNDYLTFQRGCACRSKKILCLKDKHLSINVLSDFIYIYI